MPDDLMADSGMLSLKHTSSSVFSILGFFLGFSNKGSSDSNSVRSPTFPLDFRVFSNLSNPFSPRSTRSSYQNGNRKKWGCSKEGLGIVNSLVDETKATSEVFGPSKRKNIIFGPQVRINTPNLAKHYYDSDDYFIKSKSLRRNYTIRPLSGTTSLNPRADRVNAFFGSVGLPLESKPSEKIASCLLDSTRGSSQIGSMYDPNFRFKSLPSENKTLMSSSSVLGRGLQVENSLDIKPSSLPGPIGSTHQCVPSISAREIELSEDYTCIISHGPNHKTTHIFGDCILECHTNELNNFDKVKLGIESPRAAKYQEGLTNDHLGEVLIRCYTCKRNLEGEEIYMCRGEKAFCSVDCHSEKIFAEEETVSTCDHSAAASSPESYHENSSLLGMHCQDIEQS